MSEKFDLNYKVLAPLSNFNWAGNDFSFSGLCAIKRLTDRPDLSRCDEALSCVDKEDELNSISQWLIIEQSSTEELTASEKINLFLLSLWIVLPTRTQIKFRFEFPHETGRGQSSSMVRYYDHFQRIEGYAEEEIKTEHLDELAGYFDVVREIYLNRKRLWSSLIFTLRGCMAIDWQVAFICFSAATEGILTYSEKHGITKRLAKSFACLTKIEPHDRHAAYKDFTHSYKIRSDIMHGRTEGLKDPKKNLDELAKFSDLLRELWKTVLSSRTYWSELEKTDIEREAWFTNKENGYNPPKI